MTERIVCNDQGVEPLREMIVRCRDCKHLATFQHSPGTVYCGRLSSLYQVERDGFCAWGMPSSKQARGVREDDTPSC